MIDDDIEDLLGGHPEEVRQLARQAAAAIRDSMPDAVITVARGWHSLNFRHPVAGYICGIFPYDDRVDVAFEAGHRLTDPGGVLETGPTRGTRVRYVRYRPGDEVDAPVLDALVQESIALSARR